MQRAFKALSLAGFVLATGGCKSGWIGNVAEPPDQSRVFFSMRSELFVADMRGTRKLGSLRGYRDQDLILSHDGRWALISDSEGEPGWRRAGDRLTLFDVDTGARFDSGLPFNVIPSWLPNHRIGPCKEMKKMSDVYRGLPTPTVCVPIPVLMEDGPRIWIGPVKNCFYAWSPRIVGGEWTTIDAADGPSAAAVAANWKLVDHQMTKVPDEFEYVIEVPHDGKDTRRTLWVRPDGKLVELTRRDDSPIEPGSLLVGFLGQLSPANTFGWPLGAFLYLPAVTLSAPSVMAEKAKRDAAELPAAHEKIARAVEKRRAAPVTARNAQHGE